MPDKHCHTCRSWLPQLAEPPRVGEIPVCIGAEHGFCTAGSKGDGRLVFRGSIVGWHIEGDAGAGLITKFDSSCPHHTRT